MKAVSTFGTLFLFGILAQAQSPAPATGSGAASGTINISVQGVTVAAGLKGAPFSADTVHESERVFADGNRIHQETHGRTL